MIGLDTNVLARYYIDDDADAQAQLQRLAARRLIESGQPLMVRKSVVLELEWVMRGYYSFALADVVSVMRHLLGQAHITVEDRESGSNMLCRITRQALISPMRCITQAIGLARASPRSTIASLHAVPRSWVWPHRSWCWRSRTYLGRLGKVPSALWDGFRSGRLSSRTCRIQSSATQPDECSCTAIPEQTAI